MGLARAHQSGDLGKVVICRGKKAHIKRVGPRIFSGKSEVQGDGHSFGTSIEGWREVSREAQL